MPRELKFRAFDVKEKKMIRDFLIEGIDGCEINSLLKSTPDWIVMQYTGLRDSRGVEIYESDLLFNTRTKRTCKVVEWDLNPINGLGIAPEKYRLWEDWIVIGNVYEHKNLLEAKQ